MADKTIPAIQNLRGKIGIGLISPSTPLHVKGNIRAEASGSTSFADFKSSQIWAGSTYDIIVGTNNPLYFRTNDTRRMTILGDGNVGIGETAPSIRLYVKDSENIVGYFKSTTNKATIAVADDDTLGYFSAENSRVSLGAQAGAHVNNLNIYNSNVGIGTATPTARLHIDVTTEDNQPAFKITKVSDQGENAMEVNHGTTSSARGIADFTNSAGSVLYLRGDGNVGINKTSPAQKLHIKGDALRIEESVNARHLDIVPAVSGQPHKFTSTTTGSGYQFENSSGTIALLDANGSAFYQDLTIASSNLKLSSAHYVQFGDATARIQGSNGSNYLKLYTGAVARLTITNTEATFSGDLVVSGGLTINGTTTTIDTTNLLVEDKNIVLGNVSSPSDTTADGGGITLKGASDYKIEWFNSNDSWNFNQGIIVGQDGQGHDVTFHSATSGRAMSWNSTSRVLNFGDLTSITIGAGNDLTFYHNAHSYIQSSTNHLYIINSAADGKTVFKADDGGGSSQTEYFRIDGGGGTNVFSKPLHVGVDDTGHDVKFFGATSGFYLHWDESANALTGYYDLKLADEREIQLGATNDLRLYHSSGNNFIKANSGDLVIQSDNDDLKLLAEDDIVLRDNDDSTNFIHCINGAGTRIYHTGSQKFETVAGGVTVTGKMTSDSITTAGNLELFESGNNNYISSVDSGKHLLIRNTGAANVELLVNTSEKGVIARPNGAVELYYDNSKKFETTSTGVAVTGGLTVDGSPQAGEVRFSATGINSSTYTTLCTVAGNNLASIIDMTITGTSNSVVLNSSFEILVNHYQDIHVKSVSGDYKEVTLRITSDNNEDFSIEAKHNGSTTTTIEVCIFPRAGETITPTSTDPNYTGTEYVHTATEGFRFGGTDGTTESSNLIVDGRIGIGTTSPTDTLEVQNSVGNPMLHLRPNAASTALNPIIMYRNQLNGSANYMLCEGTSTYFGTHHGGAPTDKSEMIRILPSSADAPSLRIGDSGSAGADLQIGGNIKLLNNGDSYITGGDVGIGTTSPDSPLEIEVASAGSTQTRCFHIDHNPTGNTGSGYMTIRSGTNTGSCASLEQVSSGGTSLYGTYSDTNLINHGTQTSGAYNNINFVTNDAIRMTIGGGTQAGRIGIGTTTPSRTLHVVDSAGPTIKFERSSNSNLEFQFGSTNTSIIGAGEIQFRANGGSTNKFIINNSQIQTNAKFLVNTNSGIDVHAGDSGNILLSGNSSATGTPDQFFLKHNLGNVELGNSRGKTTVTTGDFQVSTTDAANILTLHRDGSNNGANTTLNRIQFAQDYNTAQQNWGKIDLDSNALALRTDLKFYVKSTSGVQMLGMTVHGTQSDGPRVGIGTATPAEKLHVSGSENDVVIKCESTGAGAWFITSSTNQQYQGYKVGHNWFMGQHASNDFVVKDGLQSNGAIALQIVDTTRYLGINTAPTSPLHLSAAAVSLSGYPVTSMTTTIATTNIGAKLSFTGGNNANNSILGGVSMGNIGEEFAGMYAMDGGSGGATHLGLFAGTASAITEGIRILSNGAVAIKTNAVNSGITLQVNGHIYNHTGTVYAKFIKADYFSSGQSAEITSGSSGTVKLKTSSNVQLEANSGGFVKLSHVGSTSGGKFLVRTYSGDDYLNVFSTEYSTGSLCMGYGAAGKYGAAGFVSTYDNFAGHKALLKINRDGFNVLTTSTSQTDTVGADLMMTNRFTVQNDKAYFGTGNVGIGTTSPSDKLHVEGKIRIGTTPVIHSHDTITIDIDSNNNQSTNYFRVTKDGEATELMRVQEDGTVGIGVNNPNDYYYHQLVVGETTSGDKGITIRSSNAAKGVLAFADSDSGTARYSGYIAYNHSTNDMEFYTLAGNFAMMIDDGQQVGIGTTSPNYLLDVEKSGAGMRVYNTDNNGNTDIHLRTAGTTGNSRIFFGDTAVSDIGSIIYRHNGNSLAFQTNGSERMRIIGGSDGYVGIGTTSPQQKLEVDGVIKHKVYTVANLPSASSSTIGARAFVSDSYYPFSSSYLGSQISGSGSNFSPVYSDGSYWYMG